MQQNSRRFDILVPADQGFPEKLTLKRMLLDENKRAILHTCHNYIPVDDVFRGVCYAVT